MELENLVLADLKNMDLKGANILNLSCGTEETNISFEITEANIAFTARSKTDVKATALIHHGQIYTDDATLSKCDGWINYIWSVTHDTIQKHRDKLATSLDHPSQETSLLAETDRQTAAQTDDIQAAHKAGYKAARTQNIQEINKLKKKYRLILSLTILILIGTFATIWFLFDPSLI